VLEFAFPRIHDWPCGPSLPVWILGIDWRAASTLVEPPVSGACGLCCPPPPPMEPATVRSGQAKQEPRYHLSANLPWSCLILLGRTWPPPWGRGQNKRSEDEAHTKALQRLACRIDCHPDPRGHCCPNAASRGIPTGPLDWRTPASALSPHRI